MPTQIITLKDGIRIEALVDASSVAATSDQVDKSIDSIKPVLAKVTEPLAEAWTSLPKHLQVEQAEIEVGFGFEASGNIFVASAKGNVNLKVTLVIKNASVQAETPPTTAG